MTTLQSIRAEAENVGLVMRGAFHADSQDMVPPMPDGQRATTVLLLGFAGNCGFSTFEKSKEALNGGPDPLDTWSARVIGDLARRLGAIAHYPFGGPPWLPFLRWAQKAETVFVSPIGLLIHPRWGLWHSYRGALAFGAKLELPSPEPVANPCRNCSERPCLSTCPVEAFGGEGFNFGACIDHLKSRNGSGCRTRGCLARRSCPIGIADRYGASQATFYMESFAGRNLERGSE